MDYADRAKWGKRGTTRAAAREDVATPAAEPRRNTSEYRGRRAGAGTCLRDRRRAAASGDGERRSQASTTSPAATTNARW